MSDELVLRSPSLSHLPTVRRKHLVLPSALAVAASPQGRAVLSPSQRVRAWLRSLLSPAVEDEWVDDEAWLAEVLDEIRSCEWHIQSLEIEIAQLELEHERLSVPTDHLATDDRIAMLNMALARTNAIERRRLLVVAQRTRQKHAFDDLLEWIGE